MKKSNIKATVIILFVIATSLILFANWHYSKTTKTAEFDLWNEEGVIKEVIAYVEDVTDSNSKNFVPEEDRVAVFDLDGTLIGEQAPIYNEWMLYCHRVLEDKDFVATEEMKDLASDILNAAISKNIPDDIEVNESPAFGQAFDGMLVDDYKEYVKAFLEHEVDGFNGITYKEYYFRPMVEILEYLEENDFIIYIVSGTDRDFDRIILDEFYHIPYYHVIGTDCYSEGNKHDDVDYLKYQYDDDEEVMRDSSLIIKNVKSSKIMQISQEIGQNPVMAFGNSSGDQSMFTFTSKNEKYKTAIFCIVPDDDIREYANSSKVEKLTAICKEKGYHVISMKNDFLTIYGEDVTKNVEKLNYTKRLLEIYENTKQK